ncbi:hypothetical protein CPB83DRAFT_91957 [Crepidotus variabilis]|uniref:Uncharacterized protein n=1 Tax=Crepidotus variabilis TaxID=179855 RepID=A0A9P6E526_9AGAR|nr:hypothetical protein CPB83DRAFT_91957 [Crepidotus variabilis]
MTSSPQSWCPLLYAYLSFELLQSHSPDVGRLLGASALSQTVTRSVSYRSSLQSVMCPCCLLSVGHIRLRQAEVNTGSRRSEGCMLIHPPPMHPQNNQRFDS